MAFIIDKDQQLNLQQVVAPAPIVPPDAAPTSDTEPITDAQFTLLLNTMKGYSVTNDFVRKWVNYAFDPSVTQFETLRQHIRAKFNEIVVASKFSNPIDIAKNLVAAIRLTNVADPKLSYAAFHDFTGTDAEAQKIAAYADAGTSQGFDAQMDTILNETRTFPSITEEFRTRLLAQATTKLTATGIDPVTNQHAADFLGKFNAAVFGLSNFGWPNIGASMDAADIWIQGFERLSIDQTKWAKWVQGEVDTTGAAAIDKLLLKTKLEVAHDDITALGTVTSIDFDRLTQLLALANPTSANINDLFNTSNGDSLTSILNKYGVNNNLRITLTATTVDAHNKTLHIKIEYLNDPTSIGGAMPFILYEGNVNAKLVIPAIQQARTALTKIIGQVTVSKTQLHEKDLLDAGLFATLTNEERVRKINANFDWQEVTLAGFKLLTGFDLSTIAKDELNLGADGVFDYKVFVRKVNGRLEYTSVLTGGSIPTTQNTPATAVAQNMVQTPVMKTGNAFISYADIIRAAISSQAISYTNNVWLEQLLDKNGGFISSVSAKFIADHTNYQDVVNYIRQALQDAGASSTEISSRWTFATPSLTLKVSQPYSGKYTFEYSLTDNVLTRPGFTSSFTSTKDLNPPRAFATHIFSDGVKQFPFYSAFDPAHRTDISSDIALIEAPDKPPFDHPETFTGDIPYDEILWDGKSFNELLAALKARGIDFVNTPTKFVDYTVETATYSYRHNPSEPRMGGVFTFAVDIVNALTGQSERQTVSVFVVLESKPATQAEKDAAKKEVQDTADQARDAINLALSYGQKIENVDALRLKIQQIVNKFNEDLDANPLITEPKLNILKNHAEGAIMDLVKDLITSVDLNALIGKLAPILYPYLTPDQAIAKIIADPHLMEMLRKYPGVIQKLVNIKPPLSKEVLEFVLKNKNLLEMFSNFIENTSENILNKVVDGLQKTSDNYKYGYFGAGAALGLAGLGGAAATASTLRAASKAKKVTTHKIKIRSNKLISFITGGISLLAMGGSAALLILFFMKQGGF